MLTPTQIKYIQLDKKKEQYKLFLEELAEITNQLAKEVGIGGHFQDSDGTVYLVEEAVGKFVHFDRFDIKRTKRLGERAGSLSIVKAKELGYTLE